MSNALQEFIDFFGLTPFFDGTVLTVGQFVAYMILAFIGCIFTLFAVSFICELIKIFTDRRNFC